MNIKICGLNDPNNISNVSGLNPEYMGFIFYEGSPRYFNIQDAAVLKEINSGINKTGVFVNALKEDINAAIAKFKLDAIQLHGSEPPELCGYFKSKTTVIKAFGLQDDFDFTALEPYTDNVDFFLFDTATSKHGGSGRAFNWLLLEQYTLTTPFFLSGGLGLDNLTEIKKIHHPKFYGIDLNSKFEIKAGHKDITKLKQAFKLIKDDL